MSGSTRSYEMARRLVTAGHEVHMVTSCREQTDKKDWFVTQEAGINVYWLPVPYKNEMNYLDRIKAFLHFSLSSAAKAVEIEGDVVFASSTPLTIALPGIYAHWRKKIPMVFEVRDMWPAVPIALGAIRNPVLVSAAKWLERLAYRHAAHVVALAPGMREDIIAGGVEEAKVSVIPNGCDLDLFSKKSEGVSPRYMHSWLGSRKLVLYFGTIGRANGLGYMVRLAKHVSLLDPEIRFVLIGDGGEWEAVLSLAKKEGCFEKNIFIFHALPKRELVPWLHAADITVALFKGPRVLWKDAVQNKFFDALAAGKPTACNFEGFQSLIAVEHDIGFILDPSDIDFAAKKLVNALRDEVWLQGVAIRTKELAENVFNRDKLAVDLERILLNAVK